MKVLLTLTTLLVVTVHGFSNSKEYLKLYRNPIKNVKAYVINEVASVARPVTREIRKFDFDNVPPIHLGLQRGPFAVAWNQDT